ncbi:HD domain-containing phosphohydrolase [Azohydromonas sediminis]|uniref:HD domain-containing phosphohydrolase n=1 Tax=Azohydromonas sediminis TaxID=2259674 RepID=UPI000E655A3F|nr:HD domain-containing phosphohydrolase [Azohydromonas sediminis]
MDAAATATQARTPRILLVDDEPANLRLLVALLEREGYRDLVAIQDPLDVVGRYLEAPVDLILLDLNMPRLDGFAVMAQLRSLREPLLPPILVLTAQRGRDHLLRALAAGARDFVSKPFDRAELVMRVRNLLDAHLAHRLLHERQQVLAEMVRERTRELHDSRLQILRRLGRAAEFRDEETGNHILRMSHTAALLARAAGWGDDGVDLMLNAAPMHDIGKIGIPDHILLKPGPLDPGEWEIMKTHAEIGARLLEGGDCELLDLARTIAWTHHEKWDGSGYPRALAGDAIPEAGRICALADVFDALLSQRPYKRRWSFDDAVAYVKAQSGAHFEPRLVDLFVRHLDEVVAIRARYPDEAPG